MNKYKIEGIAFVPVNISIKIEGTCSNNAVAQALETLKRWPRDYVVVNSEDYDFAQDFQIKKILNYNPKTKLYE